MYDAHGFSEALQRLEQTWRDQRAPIADALAPGASPALLDEVEASIGFDLPEEVRAWWSWHDGTTRPEGAWRGVEAVIGAGGWAFLSSTEALKQRSSRMNLNLSPYVSLEDYADGDAAESDEDWEGDWRGSWLPILSSDAYALFVDCKQATPTGTAPIRSYDHTPEDVFTPVTGSLRHAIETWIWVLQERYFSWDSENRAWRDRHQDVPLPLRFRGLF